MPAGKGCIGGKGLTAWAKGNLLHTPILLVLLGNEFSCNCPPASKYDGEAFEPELLHEIYRAPDDAPWYQMLVFVLD